MNDYLAWDVKPFVRWSWRATDFRSWLAKPKNRAPGKVRLARKYRPAPWDAKVATRRVPL